MNGTSQKAMFTRLRQERRALQQEIDDLEKNGLSTSLQNWTGELSMYDNHPADIGDELFERSKDTALRDNAQTILRDIDKALERMEQGTYGICSRCGRPIPAERLDVLPWASDCMDCHHQEDQPDATPRPLEEEVLKPPFYRTFLSHSRHGYTCFDGEDCWQAVARHGSSETPQDVPGARDYHDLWVGNDKAQGRVDRMDGIAASPFHPDHTDDEQPKP